MPLVYITAVVNVMVGKRMENGTKIIANLESSKLTRTYHIKIVLSHKKCNTCVVAKNKLKQ